MVESMTDTIEEPKRGSIKKTCEYCGKEFYTDKYLIKKGWGRFCSNKCAGLSLRKRVTCVCKYCGKEFEEIPSRIKEGRGIYCSNECKYKAFALQNAGENSPNWKGGEVKHICEICGKIFYAPKCRNAKVCSFACRDALRRSERIECICLNCGKTFYKHKSSKKAQINKSVDYCSLSCLYEHRRGENSPTWRGGISYEPYCILFNNEFKERVRSFFNNECALCGKYEEDIGYKLCVHHVTYDKNACCNDSERLFVPLCRSCHIKTNSNRDYWTDYFRQIILDEYDGKCYYTKEEYDAIKTA